MHPLLAFAIGAYVVPLLVSAYGIARLEIEEGEHPFIASLIGLRAGAVWFLTFGKAYRGAR